MKFRAIQCDNDWSSNLLLEHGRRDANSKTITVLNDLSNVPNPIPPYRNNDGNGSKKPRSAK